MNRTILSVIIIVTLVSLHDGLTGQVLNVPQVIQEQDEWCWDATSCCILEYYGVDINQCTVAEYTRTNAVWHNFGDVDCCSDPGQGCNYPNQMWGDPGSAQAVMQHWGVDNYGYTPSLTLSQIQTEIAANHPFIMLWDWTTGGGHALVGYGISGTRMYYMDPWFDCGYTIGDYSWVVSSSDHSWVGTNIVTTDYVDNPLPPSNFTAYSDYRTPNSVVLHWLDPANMRSGTPISDYKIHIYRDSDFVAEIDSGVMTYTETGLTNHALCTYRARTVVPLISGSPVIASCFAGGSAVPEQPPALWARDGEDGVHLSWKNPSHQIDGTPLNDLNAILIYRDGVLVDSVFQSFADTGQVRTHVDFTTGYHWYRLRTRDSETPRNKSILTDSVLAFGAAASTYNEDFELGAGSLYRQGAWDTTRSIAYSGNASLTDSPFGDSPAHTISYVYLPPVILKDESMLRFYHIAIVNPATSLAGVNLSIDGRRTFRSLGVYNWSSYADWSDTEADPGDWKVATFDLRPYLYDTMTIQFRLVTTNGFMGDGWYVDSISVIPFNPIIADSAPVTTGWNLLSLPVRTSQAGCKSVYPCAVSAAFGYTSSYTHLDSLCPGVGYWLKFDSSAMIPMTGRLLTRDSIILTGDWNLIGTLTSPVDVSTISTRPAHILTSAFYGFDGAYSVAATLEPGCGYWIRSKQTGSLILYSNVSENITSTVASLSEKNDKNQLIFTDANGHTQILSFGVKDRRNSTLDNYDLPPLPPDEIFDVRFGTQRSRVLLGKSDSRDCKINLQGIHYPMALRWNVDNHDGSTWGIVRDSACLPMRGTGRMVFSQAPGQLLLRLLSNDEENLPQYYSLEQNFPNPFNPATTIKYQLPVESFVTIKIMNILGDVVQVLADEVQDPGYRSVEWNASNLASGIYFCRFHAVNTIDPTSAYLQTKKMLLIK
jgi:hypothetical protein